MIVSFDCIFESITFIDPYKDLLEGAETRNEHLNQLKLIY